MITKKKPRPDGATIDRYKGLSRWTYRRWAWEFLRRNNEFIEACNNAKDKSEDEKQAIAQQFGLLKFKDFKDKYKGNYGFPKFETEKLSIWTNINIEESPKRLKKIKLIPGAILIRFDLNKAITDIKAFDKQLRDAEKILKNRLDKYSEIRGKKPAHFNHSVKTFGIYIRLLDARAAGYKIAQCAQLIEPKKSEGKTTTELRDSVKHRIKQAEEYANYKYMSLPLHSGKPTSKDIYVGEKT
ncbi:hypothetical protein H8L32_17175 [Undibacterium sp. CY18W]|uniref:Transcriptional regulator-like domain-containing protein n=1 Tax=Undibacterium hunanense TaxID=2762292 RepID=A0ABR6ZTJ3_9BURK|nr:hypothetical protein [Undibacterium hunanense]MBC3919227.1 hypothetical protein [Undibacterium hunanense]